MRFSASLDGFDLTVARAADSLMGMIRERTLRKREKLLAALPISGELLRGTLLERVVRHKSGCPKCARGEGHQVYVLTVGYGRGQTRQINVRRERVVEVRRWLVLLDHKFRRLFCDSGRMQHWHRSSVVAIATARKRRIVAIELGT